MCERGGMHACVAPTPARCFTNTRCVIDDLCSFVQGVPRLAQQCDHDAERHHAACNEYESLSTNSYRIKKKLMVYSTVCYICTVVLALSAFFHHDGLVRLRSLLYLHMRHGRIVNTSSAERRYTAHARI